MFTKHTYMPILSFPFRISDVMQYRKTARSWKQKKVRNIFWKVDLLYAYIIHYKSHFPYLSVFANHLSWRISTPYINWLPFLPNFSLFLHIFPAHSLYLYDQIPQPISFVLITLFCIRLIWIQHPVSFCFITPTS